MMELGVKPRCWPLSPYMLLVIVESLLLHLAKSPAVLQNCQLNSQPKATYLFLRKTCAQTRGNFDPPAPLVRSLEVAFQCAEYLSAVNICPLFGPHSMQTSFLSLNKPQLL